MPSKKEINKSLKRMTIIQAAEEIFKTKAYNDITMDEIAERAGITKKTVYSYYPSKLALFITIVEDYLKLLHGRMFQIIDQDLPIVEKVKGLFKILFMFTAENEKLMRLYWALESEESGGEIPGELSSRINIWNKALFNEIAGLIRQGMSEDALKNVDPELIVHMISAMNKGVFIHTNKEKRFNIAHIEADQLYDLFTEIVVRQITKQPDKK